MSDSPDTTPAATPRPPIGEDASRRRLRSIIESLADGIVIVDRTGSIRFANPAAGQLFNRRPEELVGTMLGTPLVAGETTEMEILRRGGGEVVFAELRVVNVDWEEEELELVSLRDITDRKFAEERARQLTHEREGRLLAEAASRTKSDFLAIMSHELRTPLNAILGYSELIELGISGEVSATMRDQIGRIRSSGKHLLSLVNDILDLAKVEAGRLSVESAPASVAEAIGSALPLIHPQASARNLRVVVEAGSELLPPYIGDSERVRQILVNLLSNAVKCTDAGGTITISATVSTAPAALVRLQSRRPYVCVTVRDTGSGIATEKLAAIFEPFVQAESGSTRTREGSGLGLTIGQRLARAMGGELTVESTLGTGSAFHLWLLTDSTTAGTTQPVDEGSAISADAQAGSRQISRTVRRVDLRGIQHVAHGLASQLAPLVDKVVERIRCDATIPMATGLKTSQVADHLVTLLADITSALIVMEEEDDAPTPLLADSVEIQRLLGERHGTQRARLGWTEAAIRREFMIVREEVERVVRSCVAVGSPLQADDAVTAVNRFLDRAEYIGVRILEKERGQ